MNEIARTNNKIFSLIPETLDQAMQYAKLISDSDFAPKEHKGKPGNILIAIQYGAELGLSPMQALQNVSVINGRPCIWGDALLALAMANNNFSDIHEQVVNGIATCTVERKNREPVVRTFSMEDAKKAGLLGKPGPWSSYTNRMLQLRARAFALRDAFPDVLRGLSTREEIEDVEEKNEDPIKARIIESVTEPKVQEIIVIELIEERIEDINLANSLDDLEKTFTHHYKELVQLRDKESLALLIKAKDEKKEKLKMVEDFNKEIDQPQNTE